MAGLWGEQIENSITVGGRQYVKDLLEIDRPDYAVYEVHSISGNDFQKKDYLETVIGISSCEFQNVPLDERKEILADRKTAVNKEIQQLINDSYYYPSLQYEYGDAELSEEPLKFTVKTISRHVDSLESFYYKDATSTMKLCEVIKLAKTICSTMSELCKKQLYHRNITPNAIGRVNNDYTISLFCLHRKGKIKASEFSDREKSYLAPELFSKLDHYEYVHFENVNEASEIYSVGAVLYELLNNKQILFKNNSSSLDEANRRRLSGEIPVLPKNGTMRLGKFVRKACSPVEKRFTSFDEMVQELDDIYINLEKRMRLNDTIYQSFLNDEGPIPYETEEKTVIITEPEQVIKENTKDEKIDDLDKKQKMTIVYFVLALLIVVVIIAMVFMGGNSSQNRGIRDEIDRQSYGVAITHIEEIYQSGKDVDEICVYFVEACLEDGNTKNLPLALSMMSDETLQEEYAQNIIDSLNASGEYNTYSKVLKILEEKGISVDTE